MEWNEVGRTHSTGDLSQQGLLPEVHCTACTKGVLTKTTKYQRTLGSVPRVAYIAGDTSHHQPMGAGHMTVLQLCGPMGFRVLQWCHPMLAHAKRTSYCTWMITLYGARKWIQARAVSDKTQFDVKQNKTMFITDNFMFKQDCIPVGCIPPVH